MVLEFFLANEVDIGAKHLIPCSSRSLLRSVSTYIAYVRNRDPSWPLNCSCRSTWDIKDERRKCEARNKLGNNDLTSWPHLDLWLLIGTMDTRVTGCGTNQERKQFHIPIILYPFPFPWHLFATQLCPGFPGLIGHIHHFFLSFCFHATLPCSG